MRAGRPGPPLDRFDRHILQFVLAWAPFGGAADDDAFIEFGLHCNELHHRFADVVTTLLGRVRDLDNADRALLARACTLLHTLRHQIPSD